MRRSDLEGGLGRRRAAPPLPLFVDFQHPKGVARPPSGPGWLHEIKYDGYRVQLRVLDGRAWLHTRGARNGRGEARAA
jgi:bifunctional non-homologous end joining protein LigD